MNSKKKILTVATRARLALAAGLFAVGQHKGRVFLTLAHVRPAFAAAVFVPARAGWVV